MAEGYTGRVHMGFNQREELIENVVRDVAELPDRTSPTDQPEMMLVTGKELTEIIRNRLTT